MNSNELLSLTPPWLGRWVADYDAVYAALWRLRGEERSARKFIGSLRGRKMRRREGVFEQFGALLQFPHYFGDSWNAFVDCIEDLEWLRADALVIVITDASELLADGDVDELAVLLKILADAADAWAKVTEFRPARPFHVVLHTTAEDLPGFAVRLADQDLAPVLL